MSRLLTRTSSHLHVETKTLWPSLAAILLGAFFIIGAGFAQPSALHNAAHDSRHSVAFPCH
ncbi:MAG: CbtB domain-containing protein [Alphaproteobacteria bacterium]|jgi:cobalt transporter subunit CbtB|nr:CbtB domain-containing protein [Alphaproteobacteria bacterium]